MVNRNEFSKQIEQMGIGELKQYQAIIGTSLLNHKHFVKDMEIKSELISNELYRRSMIRE